MGPGGRLAPGEKLELLGYPPDSRLLIVNGDDLGMCHAQNAGTFAAMERGLVTSASLMAPCPWAYDACVYLQSHPELDAGVHLTFTSEWATYRWGPVLDAQICPSLCDPLGFFPSVEAEVWKHAADGEILAEAEAQIERAIAFGLDPTHLDGHMDTVYGDPRFLAVYTNLARCYRLPLRMAPRRFYEQFGSGALYDSVDLAGLLTNDDLRLLPLENPPELEAQLIEMLNTLEPGITELGLHTAAPTLEAQAIMPDWDARAEALRLMTEAPAVREAMEQSGIICIGWRDLREVQRALPEDN